MSIMLNGTMDWALVLTVDDVCPENLKWFRYMDEAKKDIPGLSLIAFVIANYKNEQDVSQSREFYEWFMNHKDWVEIGVHGYDHESPPEQERDDAEQLVEKSLEILKPYLPEKYLYRPPGHQRTIRTEPMLRKLGFSGIAYQWKIKYFEGRVIYVINSHCSGRDFNPLPRWREFLNLNPGIGGLL